MAFEASALDKRPQTVGEEIANAISHGIGFLFAIASLPMLVAVAARHGSTVHVAAATVFSVSMMLTYLASALYHAAPQGATKAWLNRLDHAAIYLFIAGTYTPFALGMVHGRWGWTLFVAVWAMAAAGIAAKLLIRLMHPLLSTGLYIAVGWLALLAAGPLLAALPSAGLAWVLAGAGAYTAGAIVYLFDARAPYLHFVWHLFVLLGTLCHFLAALWYAIPGATLAAGA